MKLQVQFTVDVFLGGDEDATLVATNKEIEESILYGIKDALGRATNNGFNHPLDRTVSMFPNDDVTVSFQEEQPDVRGCLEEIEEWLDDGMINGVHYDEQSIADSIRGVLSKLPKQEGVADEQEADA